MYSRNISQKVLEALADTPVVTLHGARQAGKSTLVRELARQSYPAQYFTLDDLGVLAAARRDPAGFIAGISGPAVIDEAQRAPDLLLAIKAHVDRARRPGRFLLTGSAHILNLPRLADTLAGRMEVLTLWPLSQGEIQGVREKFIDALFAHKLSPRLGEAKKDKTALVKRMLTGGFPEALTRSRPDRRRAWFESYVGAIVQREVRDLANISGLADMPRLLMVLAARAAGLINYADLARDSGLNQVTLKRYFTLLHNTFLVYTVPPWFTNRIKRLVKSPKLYFSDTGVLAHLLDLTPENLGRDPHAEGALFENFVVMELVKQSAWSQIHPKIYHFRDSTGNEVDFLLEAPGANRYVGVEVKAGATVGHQDFKGLKLLAAALGESFHRGVVLYAGDKIVPFAGNLHAIPMGAMYY